MRILSKNLRIQTVKPCRCEYCEPPMLKPITEKMAKGILLAGVATAFIANLWRKNRSAE